MSKDGTPPNATTQPARDPNIPTIRVLPDGRLEVFDADPNEGDLSPAYYLDVFGIIVSVYLRMHGAVIVHVDTVTATSPPFGAFLHCELNGSPIVDVSLENDQDDVTPHPATTEHAATTVPHGSEPGLDG